jgi:hypothetical protein
VSAIYSNSYSSIMYGSDLGFICYLSMIFGNINLLLRECQEYISAHCLLCSNQLFDCFLPHISKMVNDVPENDDYVCLNPVSRLAGAVNCGVHMILSIHCNSLVVGQKF